MSWVFWTRSFYVISPLAQVSPCSCPAPEVTKGLRAVSVLYVLPRVLEVDQAILEGSVGPLNDQEVDVMLEVLISALADLYAPKHAGWPHGPASYGSDPLHTPSLRLVQHPSPSASAEKSAPAPRPPSGVGSVTQRDSWTPSAQLGSRTFFSPWCITVSDSIK